ncbi:MAG: hypothetical protein ACI4R9_01310 [Kiritimatiellia bacterium]
MKKLSLLAAVTAMAAGAFALPSYVMFSSTGPDKYADGTEVLDGEVYALVWAKTGTAFAGFNADGSLVDAANNKLVSAVPIAKDAHCPPVMYMLTGANADLDSTGTFSVYLLDTRVAAADGTKTVAGISSEGVFTAVNTTTVVAAEVQGGSQTTATSDLTTGAAAVATTVPADAPMPKVAAIKVVGGKVVVTVTDTVPYLQYGISAGKTPDKLDQTDLVQGINGTAEDLTLVVDSPEDNRFFKVIRK